MLLRGIFANLLDKLGNVELRFVYLDLFRVRDGRNCVEFFFNDLRLSWLLLNRHLHGGGRWSGTALVERSCFVGRVEQFRLRESNNAHALLLHGADLLDCLGDGFHDVLGLLDLGHLNSWRNLALLFKSRLLIQVARAEKHAVVPGSRHVEDQVDVNGQGDHSNDGPAQDIALHLVSSGQAGAAKDEDEQGVEEDFVGDGELLYFRVLPRLLLE